MKATWFSYNPLSLFADRKINEDILRESKK